jgi:hypothetical protein
MSFGENAGWCLQGMESPQLGKDTVELSEPAHWTHLESAVLSVTPAIVSTRIIAGLPRSDRMLRGVGPYTLSQRKSLATWWAYTTRSFVIASESLH